MKKRISLILAVFAMMLCLVLTSCGQKAISNLEILEGLKYTYELNEAPDFSDIQVQVKFNDGTYKVVGEKDLTISEIDTSTPGQKELKISYQGFEITTKVTVAGGSLSGGDEAEATLTEISYLSGIPAKIIAGDTLDTSAIKVQAKYDDGSVKTISASELTFSAVDTASAGTKEMTITYNGKTATANVVVIGIKSITLITTEVNTQVMKGETVDVTELSANVVYTDDSAEVIDVTNLTVDAIDTAECGEKVINVSYKGASATFTVKVDGIKEIQIVPSSVNTVRPEGDDTPIDTANLKLLAVYYFSAASEIEYTAEEITVTQPDWTADEKFFSVTYAGFTASIKITETDPVIEAIEIVESTVSAKVKLGETFSTEGIQVQAIYSNGSRENIAPTDTKLVFSNLDTSVAGTATLTATYGEGITDTATVTVIEVTSITISGLDTYVLQGETFSYDKIVVTLHYSDNETVEILKSGYTVNEIDTAVAGDASVTVTYNGITSSGFTVNVATVASVEIDGSSVANSVELGKDIDTTGLSVIVTLSNGVTLEKTIADGVTVNLASFDNTVAGDTYITATYKGVTSDNFKISVKYVEKDYYLADVELPDAITLREKSQKKQFKDQTAVYVVGDDNPFVFTLKLLVYDSETDEPRIDITSYESVSAIFLDGAEITDPVELAKWVVINEKENSFDFSEAAIGKTFTIKTRPLFIEADEIADMTKELTVKIVDGYNVTRPEELNLLTNINDTFGDNGINQLTVVDNFLANLGIVRPAEMNGIVLHNNFALTTEHIPSQYLITLDAYSYEYVDKDGNTQTVNVPAGSKAFNDHFSVFHHQTTSTTPFTFHGNYFTINSHQLPCVAPKGQGGNSEGLSSSQLFKFDTVNTIVDDPDFDHTLYTTNIENLFLRDDDQTDNDNANSQRHLLGLIALKVAKGIHNTVNTNIHCYFISYFADYDCLTINIDKCDFYNSWQNHIMSWSENNIDDDNSEPHKNHTHMTINITGSRIAKCGGPVIISSSRNPQYTANKMSRAEYNISEDSLLYSYVTGQEAWFTAMQATPIAQDILKMNMPISMAQTAYGLGSGTGFATTLPNNGDTQFINLIMINMESMDDASGLLGATNDVDGSVKIGDQTILDMNDVGDGKYGNETVNTIKGTPLGAAPIFNSSAGGTAALVPDASMGLEPGFYNADMSAYASTELFLGDYLTLYYGSMGVILGYNMETPTEY